jgi:hypothetical protein
MYILIEWFLVVYAVGVQDEDCILNAYYSVVAIGCL